MSGGGSSNSKSDSNVNTVTEQKDERVTATDDAIVIQSGALAEGAELNIEQIPEAVLTVFEKQQDSFERVVHQAVVGTQTLAENSRSADQQNQKILVNGLLGMAALFVLAIIGSKK